MSLKELVYRNDRGFDGVGQAQATNPVSMGSGGAWNSALCFDAP